MGKRRTWRWVTRNYGRNFVSIWVGAEKPARPTGGEDLGGLWFAGISNNRISMCAGEFFELTGLTIPTDRPVKVEFSARVVE